MKGCNRTLEKYQKGEGKQAKRRCDSRRVMSLSGFTPNRISCLLPRLPSSRTREFNDPLELPKRSNNANGIPVERCTLAARSTFRKGHFSKRPHPRFQIIQLHLQLLLLQNNSFYFFYSPIKTDKMRMKCVEMFR